MKRYAIIGLDNVVENIILWDEVSQWQPPDGRAMVKVEDILCDIGWKYENNGFSDPNKQITQE